MVNGLIWVEEARDSVPNSERLLFDLVNGGKFLKRYPGIQSLLE